MINLYCYNCKQTVEIRSNESCPNCQPDLMRTTRILRPETYYFAFSKDELLVNSNPDRLRGINGFIPQKHYVYCDSPFYLKGSNFENVQIKIIPMEMVYTKIECFDVLIPIAGNDCVFTEALAETATNLLKETPRLYIKIPKFESSIKIDPIKCECGAHKTNSPNLHAHWCPKFN